MKEIFKPLKQRIEKWAAIQKDELALTVYSFAYFFFLLAGYYILRPLRDEMGIRGGIQNLQWLFTGTFAAILIGVPIYAAVVAKFPRQKFLPWVYHFFIANILIFWILLQTGTKTEWTARAFFIWTSVFNLFVVSVFWSFMVDIFKKEQAGRLFGFIAAGGTTGALIGPLLTIALANRIGAANLLIVSAILLELAVGCIRKILQRAGSGKSETKTAVIGGNAFSGIQIVFRSQYLVTICLYVFLMTAGSTFQYFAQAHIVSEALSRSQDRTVIFATIDFWVNILTFFIQTVLTGKIISKFGIPFTLAFLPGMMTAGFLTLSLAPVLFVMVLFQILGRAVRYAVTQPAREILFTVVSREEKYKSKNFIDTVVYRGGDAMSAWIYRSLEAAGISLPGMMLVGVLTAFIWAAVGIYLGRRHNALQLPQSLS